MATPDDGPGSVAVKKEDNEEMEQLEDEAQEPHRRRPARGSPIWQLVECTGRVRAAGAERQIRCKIHGCHRPELWEKKRSNGRIVSHLMVEHGLDMEAMREICASEETLLDVLTNGRSPWICLS